MATREVAWVLLAANWMENVLIGGFFVLRMLLLALKIGLDLKAHLKEHSAAES